MNVTAQSATGTTCEVPVDESVCKRCGICSGIAGNRRIRANIELPVKLLQSRRLPPLMIGQAIEMEVPAGLLLVLSSVVYLLPVVLMLFFMVCCNLLFPDSEALIAVSAILGLGVGLGAIVFFGPSLRSHIAKRLMVRSTI